MRRAERAPTGIPQPVLACEDAQYRALMVRYQAGDAEAFTALYAQLSPVLSAYFDQLVPGLGGDATLLDEVFLAIHDARRSYRPRCSFNAWVAAIAQHVVSTRQASGSAQTERVSRRGRAARRGRV